MTTPNSLSIDTIKRKLQDHFGDGLAIIIGSGLSCAEGIPGMADIATHLSKMLPSRISESDKALWSSIEQQLSIYGLEGALTNPISDTLEREILLLISSYLIDFEQRVIKEVVLGSRQLRLTRLLRHLFNKIY